MSRSGDSASCCAIVEGSTYVRSAAATPRWRAMSLRPKRGQIAGAHVVQLGQHPGVHHVAARRSRSGGSRWCARRRRAGPAGRAARCRRVPRAGACRRRRARASMYSRSKRKMLWPSITSGSRSPMMRVVSASSAGLVEAVAADDVAEAGRVGQRDGHDAVGRALRAGELVAVAGDDLDVERQAPQLAEAHAAERRTPAREQVLLHGIGHEPVGRAGRVSRHAAALATQIARGQGLRPGAEARQPAQFAAAGQRVHAEQSGGIGHQRGVGEQQERGERHERGDGRCHRRAARRGYLGRFPRGQRPGAGAWDRLRTAGGPGRSAGRFLDGSASDAEVAWHERILYPRSGVCSSHAPAGLGGDRRLGCSHGLRRVRRVIPEREPRQTAHHFRSRGAPGRARTLSGCGAHAWLPRRVGLHAPVGRVVPGAQLRGAHRG